MSEEEVVNVELQAPNARPIDQVVNTGLDPENSTIYLADIDEGTGTWFRMALDFMNAQAAENGPITIALNTPGGDVVSMFAIHDAIRTSRRPTRVIGTGQICSAGVLLLACGHYRVVTESCCLMSHESTSGAQEGLGLRAAKDRRKYEDWMHQWWCELMGRYTRDKDAAWWRRITERKAEYWLLGGRRIVEEGLADEVA